MEKTQRTELTELGEFGLIDHLTKDIVLKNKSSVKGVGDDAAVIDNGQKLTLVSTDLLVEGVHFDLSYTPLKHLGYKAVSVNISDIVAMNGTARQVLVGLSVSNRFSVEAIEELYDGIKQACKVHNVDLAGGDTTSSVSGLFISITVIGDVEREDVVYRYTSRENDLVCVTGDLGGAYMGLLLLEREKAMFKDDPSMQPDLEGHDYILSRQLKPEPRTDIIRNLHEIRVKPTAMIDISDGLGSEVLHLCKGSGLGCMIYEDKIPIDLTTVNAAADFNISPVTTALNGGEDYELLFTIGQQDFEKIRVIPGISVIGHMTAPGEGAFLVTGDDQLVEIRAQGWNALKRKD
ncbi:MAG: thiamine-phosphate kinase [Bacteroidales bacterium]|nr:thiamine-phosphate kinase [Bacteroidales bacterium]